MASVTDTSSSLADRDRRAIDWLLASDEPGIRLQARRDLLDEESPADAAAVMDGPRVRALLEGQRPDGGFGDHPYKKWWGAHWRLVAMVELGVPAGEPRALAAGERVLRWLSRPSQAGALRSIGDRPRSHASMHGNALAACVRLGLAGDPRVRQLVEWLIAWQWPDGGWNCDQSPAASHSSFHETFVPVWALAEYARATGSAAAAEAAQRAGVFLLDHLLFRSHTTGEVVDKQWLKTPYPWYWHYNFLAGLTVLARAGRLPDARATQALELLESRRAEDGLWHAQDAPYWRRTAGTYYDPVAWERSGPSLMLTLHALRVLRAAGRLRLS